MADGHAGAPAGARLLVDQIEIAPIVDAAIAYTLSLKSPKAMNTTPRTSTWTVTNPRCTSTN